MYTHYYQKDDEVSEASSQLLRVSKQIYHEGASILYGENRFYAQNSEELVRIVQLLGPNTVYVRNLKLDYSRSVVHEPRTFSAFVGLKTLYFTWGLTVEAKNGLRAKHTLLVGSKVRSRDFDLLPRPGDLVQLSRDLLDKCRLTDGLMLYLDVFADNQYLSVRKFSFAKWHYLISNDSQRYAWEGTYRYRINPTPKDSPENSSLIKENYDLVFEEHIDRDK